MKRVADKTFFAALNSRRNRGLGLDIVSSVDPAAIHFAFQLE